MLTLKENILILEKFEIGKTQAANMYILLKMKTNFNEEMTGKWRYEWKAKIFENWRIENRSINFRMVYKHKNIPLSGPIVRKKRQRDCKNL
jgi:hypothetical protein